MIQIKETTTDYLFNHLLSEDVREQFLYFENCLQKRKDLKNKSTFHIVIDNMSFSSINLYLEYIIPILQAKEDKNEVVEIKKLNEIKRWEDTIVVVSIDRVEDFEYSWRFDEDDLLKILLECEEKHNILIFTSVKPIGDCSVFQNKDILLSTFVFPFHGRENQQDTYQKLIQLFVENKIPYSLSFEEFETIYQCIRKNHYIIHFNIEEYLYNYAIMSEQFFHNKCIDIHTFDQLKELEKKEEDEFAEKKEGKKLSLKNLTGLGNVKKEIRNLFHYAAFIKNMNIDQDSTYLNMLFLGNPGTGKTMISNIVAQKLYDLGYLESDKVIKIVPNDLIGEYVGHTKSTTRKILDKARGKLLFIDEAYLICSKDYKNGRNPFMEEAVVELLKYLEDPKNIVIFAGYKDELRELYQVNPGIQSRIYKEIVFEDYSVQELYKILSSDLEKKGMKIDVNSRKELFDYIKSLREEDNFGNARSMLQLSQKLIMNHANRHLKKDNVMIDSLDIPKEVLDTKKRLGFAVYDRR